MANFSTADPFSPLIDPSSNSLSFYPDLAPKDHIFLQHEITSNTDFNLDLDDINWDLSIDDLLLPDYSAENSPPFPPSCEDSTESVDELKSKWGIKRKNESDQVSDDSTVNPRSSKFRRGEKTKSCVFDDDDKRNARLMRNRESAQLSRQRKKHYVEELEDKVRSLHSTIAELNSKISFFMTENASLKQQLGGSNGSAVVAPVHFPWIPFQGVAFRPHGSSVPLVAIPKLRLQKNENDGKAAKCERRKSGSRSKKVASVSLLGILFVLVICRGLVFRDEFEFEERNGFYGRVLSVSGGRSSSLNCTNEVGFDRMTNRSSNEEMGSEEKTLPFDDHSYSQNSSDSLPAFLYVSRNGKKVKINGNLIINAVLASEKAVAQSKFRNQGVKSATKEEKESVFEVHGNLASALALSKSSNGVNRHSKNHGSSAEPQRALASDSEDLSKEKTLDGPLQQWFLEGLAGPIFSTGTCTEVFQFETSPTSSAEQSGIIPAADSTNASSINTTENLHGSSSHPERRNRRFLYPRGIPLAASSLNYSEHLGKAPESNGFPSNTSATPMVVSILVDPREVGDADVDEVLSTKNSISRIFVVVLLDSVKYVTYSCVLPLMSPGPHLVN